MISIRIRSSRIRARSYHHILIKHTRAKSQQPKTSLEIVSKHRHAGVHTISPHTTLCRYKLRLFSSVRNPSLPAINSLQSLANWCRIFPASSTWLGLRPNIMHLPIRRFIMVSHRGSIVCGRAGAFSGVGVGLRAFCAGTVVERARRAQRE